MVQSAQSRQRQNSAGNALVALFDASGGRFLRQSEVRPIIMVIANVLGHETFHMAFIQNDHMVK
jgi:hypothetical protein